MTLTLIAVVPKAEPNADATRLRVLEGLDLGQRWSDHERAVASYVPVSHFLCGFEELHRERVHAFHMSWLHRALYDYAYPDYECEQCVGQYLWAGCECHHHGLPGPCVEIGALRALARDVWSVVARRCGMYDPGRR